MGEGGQQATADTFSYDPMTGRLNGQAVVRGGSKLLDLHYDYHPNGQLDSILDAVGTERAYVYDALGRLTKVTNPLSNWSIDYDYDRYGNRTSVNVTGHAADGSAIPSDGVPNVAYDPATNHIRDPGYSYDAAGNVTRSKGADGSWLSYLYDAAGRLADITSDTGHHWSYSYGADGRRMVSQDPGGFTTYYAWDGDHVIGEYGRQRLDPSKLSWFLSNVYLGLAHILGSFGPLGAILPFGSARS
jgi:YD repeat-containing protein